MGTVWRDMDLAALDREYNARASVPDFDAEYRRFVNLSATARATLTHTSGLVFDPASGNALDWFDGAPAGPAVLWIHGGFWRALAKEDQSLIAPGLVAAGAHVAVMDYSLAPAATLDEIVRQARAACAWVAANAQARGADPARLFVAGHSAGGQLVGMLLASGWERPPLRGAIAVSGLFDLEPIRRCHVNAWLGLDEAAAARLSPLHHLPPPAEAPPLLAAYGARESGEFRRQTEDYVAAWTGDGRPGRAMPIPGRHHFDILVELGEARGPLCREVVTFMEAA